MGSQILDLARSSGVPVPRYDLIAEMPSGIAIVQERLPGRAPEHVDRALVESMVATNEQLAGLLAGRPEIPAPPMHLDHSADGFCVHESLERYDDRTRRLLGWVRAVGRSEPSDMTGDDLVHLDFHTGNVLVDAGNEVCGIVDWDGVGRGDRRFALVTLRFDLAAPRHGVDPALQAWFDEMLDDVLESSTLRMYWAHMSLRMVDWAIRHDGPADVTHWLDFAATRAA